MLQSSYFFLATYLPHTRGNTEFPYLLEDGQKGGHKDSTILERDEITFDLNQLYADLRVLEEQNWITWSANTKDSWSSSSKKQKTNTTHPGQEIGRAHGLNSSHL